MSLAPEALQAVLSELQPLCGRRVAKLWAPARSTIVLRLRGPEGRDDLLIELAHPRARLGVVKVRPRGEATPWQKQLRDALEGVVLESLLQRVAGDRIVSLTFRGKGVKTELLLEMLGGRWQAFLLDERGRILVAAAPERLGGRGLVLHELWKAPTTSPLRGGGTRLGLEGLAAGPFPISAALDRVYAPLDRAAEIHDARRLLRRALLRARARARRTRTKLEASLEGALAAPPLRAQGELLKSALARVRRGLREVRVRDWYDPEGGEVCIVLDPKLGPKANLEAIFKRARRLERGAKVAGERRVSVLESEAKLRELIDAVDAAQDAEALEALWVSARALGVKRPSTPVGKSRKVPERLPYRTFISGSGSGSGVQVLVGRSARDNHALTFKVARGRDLWLHVRDYPGSHVVVRSARGEAPDPATLIDAGLLAVHFSEAREAGAVEVSFTERKHLHHPPGAAPGLVSMARARTLRVVPDPERLAALFRSER